MRVTCLKVPFLLGTSSLEVVRSYPKGAVSSCVLQVWVKEIDPSTLELSLKVFEAG